MQRTTFDRSLQNVLRDATAFFQHVADLHVEQPRRQVGESARQIVPPDFKVVELKELDALEQEKVLAPTAASGLKLEIGCNAPRPTKKSTTSSFIRLAASVAPTAAIDRKQRRQRLIKADGRYQ